MVTFFVLFCFKDIGEDGFVIKHKSKYNEPSQKWNKSLSCCYFYCCSFPAITTAAAAAADIITDVEKENMNQNKNVNLKMNEEKGQRNNK